MAKIDMVLKKVFNVTVLVCLFITGLLLSVYFAYQQRQAERELIYLKARELVKQEQQDRLRDYQKRLQQRRLTQEYNKGRVVNMNQPTQPAQSAAPADTAAAQK
ncbi:MAG: hypothetical protein IKN49_05875 [Elusimicrobiaceae bacterium]|nr:hypothetical protein [Elusimicrobiaceae bacterium]